MQAIARRALLQRALVLAGAAVSPGFSGEALAQAWEDGARQLGAAHFDLLSAVADTIVPQNDTAGAIAAGVPKKFDAMLRLWASPARRSELIGALEAIDKLALKQHKQPFAKLTPALRTAVLAPHDAVALAAPASPAAPATPPTVTDPNYGRAKQEPPQTKPPGQTTKPAGESLSMMSGPAVADPAYAKLKELIVTLYYVSEQALTQELRYEHAPGQWQPSVPVTPETRPSGGLAFI